MVWWALVVASCPVPRVTLLTLLAMVLGLAATCWAVGVVVPRGPTLLVHRPSRSGVARCVLLLLLLLAPVGTLVLVAVALVVVGRLRLLLLVSILVLVP